MLLPTASLNGTSILAGGAAGTFADAGRPLNIGKRNDGVTGLNGWIQEVVTFSTVASATDIRYLQWTQSVYYNISGPVLGTLPAGAQSGSVTIWYDQSGNAKNATAAAVANQPRIITAGVISRRNSWPVIIFDGASDYLTAATTNNAFNTTNGGTINGIGSNNGAASWQCMAQQGRNASPWWGIWGSSAAPAKWTGGNDSGPGNLSSSVNSNSYCAVTYIQNAAAVSSVIVNGVTPGVTGNPSITHANAQLFYIGYGATGSEYWNGSISELNVFALNLNDTRRILLQSNQNAYHALSHAAANIKYTTSAVASAATYTRYVLGIGSQTTASSPQDSVCETRQSAGMGFTVSTNVATAFLKNNGDYMCAGMSCPTFSTSNTFTTAPIQLRWQNDWFIDKTDVGVAGGTVSIYFDFGDYNIGTSPGAASGYSLLNRPTTASNFTVVAGATANVVGDRVYFTVDANNIVDNSFFTIGSTYPPNSPLPVELVNFKAEACDKDVCLDWKTASELNNDYFSIERSVDAESWTEIKKVKGAGTSQRTLNYSAMDYEPLPGISYYRLKQTDFDKNFKYSKIEAVEFKNTLEVGIYPNPSSGVFNISNCKGYDKLTITDMLGRKVYTADVEKDFMLLELNTLEAGSYFITLNNSVSNKKFTSKIIIDKK
ncbi:MAG: T9SS type A sorting domain-containing protein [Sphingobacteriaceae bacterium]|nr:T9SS type A sorting domain-containing protein [Sphingobacteriaceae bacterium]